MEKKILLFAVYFSLAGTCVQAQHTKIDAPPVPPLPPIENVTPPLPPDPPVSPAPPEVPVPPVPPSPPPEPAFTTAVIVNSNGYDISVRKINGVPMVIAEKDGVTNKIRLSTWNADKKLYEKKYGQLPPKAEEIKLDTAEYQDQ